MGSTITSKAYTGNQQVPQTSRHGTVTRVCIRYKREGRLPLDLRSACASHKMVHNVCNRCVLGHHLHCSAQLYCSHNRNRNRNQHAFWHYWSLPGRYAVTTQISLKAATDLHSHQAQQPPVHFIESCTALCCAVLCIQVKGTHTLCWHPSHCFVCAGALSRVKCYQARVMAAYLYSTFISMHNPATKTCRCTELCV